jgi:hypothetical protein
VARRRFGKRGAAERSRSAFVRRVDDLTDEEIAAADWQGLLDMA